MKSGIRRLNIKNLISVFQSGIRRLRFWCTKMVFGSPKMVLGVRKWCGGMEMVFNDYKSQPPDATFHYFDIVVGNAH